MPDRHLALQADIAEIPRLLDWAEAACAEAGIARDIALKLALVLEEAVANAVNHGFQNMPPPHRIAVRLELAADRLVAEVVDNACPFDPTAAPDADTAVPLAERSPGGLGIRLIRTMMDRVEYRRVGGENRLRLEKSLS